MGARLLPAVHAAAAAGSGPAENSVAAGLAMPGGMESLNVSAAAAVALYELTRS